MLHVTCGIECFLKGDVHPAMAVWRRARSEVVPGKITDPVAIRLPARGERAVGPHPLGVGHCGVRPMVVPGEEHAPGAVRNHAAEILLIDEGAHRVATYWPPRRDRA